MNETTLRPGSIALAAVVIGGALIAILPPYAMSIVRLVIATVAAAAGLYALGVNAPPAWWASPFDRRRWRLRMRNGADDIARIRSRLSGWRQPTGEMPLPADVVALLKPLIESALERQGVDAEALEVAGSMYALSPATRAVLQTDVRDRAPWYRLVPPQAGAVATAVHDVLDDLDRLGNGEDAGRGTNIQHPGAQ